MKALLLAWVPFFVLWLALVIMSPIEQKPLDWPAQPSTPVPQCLSYQRLTVIDGRWACVEIERKNRRQHTDFG